MAISNESINRNKRHQLILLAVAMLIGIFGIGSWLDWRSKPQLGPSPAIMKTVDALFTGIGNRNIDAIEDCERRLREAKDTGTLPLAAWEYLDDIIARAKSGNWRSAAESLYSFMLDQRGSTST